MSDRGHGNNESRENDLEIRVGSVTLPGVLVLPPHPRATIIFAHGSGSSRLSPRNNYVARVLHESGFGTLLFDLLTPEEDEAYENRFDIELLASRLGGATYWLRKRYGGNATRLGYFGASTGAAAALQASVGHADILAVVSRGGRPDLAWDHLKQVSTPTLLIVGGRDEQVIELNKRALAELNTKEKQLTIIPGATHLFEESGALEKVAEVARDWFLRFAG